MRTDLPNDFSGLVPPANDTTIRYLTHRYEGDDDMPAHLKSSIFGNNITIPITDGNLNLGTWQGIYLGEHRDYGGSRKIVATIMGK